MHTDMLIGIHRRIRKLDHAERKADSRRDFAALGRCLDSLRSIHELERHIPPRSNAGAAIKLRGVVDVARLDTDPDAPGIAFTTRRVAKAVEMGVWTVRNIAELRALLPAARRIDSEIESSLAIAISGAVAWLARPKLVLKG